jgi:hypothetical protein
MGFLSYSEEFEQDHEILRLKGNLMINLAFHESFSIRE